MSTVAAYPLNDISFPSGGVVLKSSDGIEFKVYKNILALASPFFRQMFALPQPIDRDDVQPVDSDYVKTQMTGTSEPIDLQIVSMSESSSSLDILLRLIYPIVPPSLPGMSEAGQVVDARAFVNGLEPVLDAALKYDMSSVVKDLTSRLLDAAETTLPDGNIVDDTLALRVFVLACRHKLKEEARRAAYASLKGRVSGTFIEELRHISAAQYFHLVQFYNKMVDKIRSLLEKGQPPSPWAGSCSNCGSSSNIDLWDQFVARALPILVVSPRSSRVFSSAFFEVALQSVQRSFRSYSCCNSLHEDWGAMCRGLQESIEMAAIENVIDLSEI